MSGAATTRVYEYLENNNYFAEEQGGFRRNRGTDFHIFNLHQVLYLRKAQNLGSIVAFIDLRKAYDKVWIQGLRVKLLRSGVTGRMYNLFKNMLASQSRRVRSPTDQSLSQPFHIDQGLPQGAPESPVLFALFINDLIERLKQRGCGVQFANTRRPGLFFADDIALVAAALS